ncbi:fa2h [Drosophila busckii]|uniref:Fa2h n=1 Tax=Drosophila busckii TaxID=30019 RepID=A0A0M4E4C1_DROBS|nr:fa2h [Drosophila busckii]
MAELSDKFIVKYRQQLYDLSQFMHKHPGGINTLKGLSQADITARFQKAPPHSDAAMYLMREYKVNDGASRRLETAKLKAIELPEQSNSSEEDNNNNHLDESMERCSLCIWFS